MQPSNMVSLCAHFRITLFADDPDDDNDGVLDEDEEDEDTDDDGIPDDEDTDDDNDGVPDDSKWDSPITHG